MFNGQIATITSLAPGDTTVTITITNPNNNPLVRNVTVAYTAQNENIFAGILGVPTLALAGSSTASASIAANINFYLLLDNSPSMALPATQAGITADAEPHSAAGQLRVRLPSGEHQQWRHGGQSVLEGRDVLDPDAHQQHKAAAIRTALRRKERKSTTSRSRAKTESSCASTPSARGSAI